MIDPTNFVLINIVDTCAVWNILSSRTLYQGAVLAKCQFAMTQYVEYECVHKKRKMPISKDRNDLIRLLRVEQGKNRFTSYSMDLEGLQIMAALKNHKRLGKGELSSIAMAMKIRQAVLTDDQPARKFASRIGHELVQTTPHLFSWLIFKNYLGDADKNKVIDEHISFGGSLKEWLEEAYEKALQCLLNTRAVNS